MLEAFIGWYLLCFFFQFFCWNTKILDNCPGAPPLDRQLPHKYYNFGPSEKYAI
jgi:hypothetical protein